MKIANVDFPEPLLNALRDGRLVVFAGAGVSMGPPGNLPDFRRLAQQVSEGTGQAMSDAETEDRFLGRLSDLGTDVHRRAADVLTRNNPEPTPLHLSLLRLFSQREPVRVVTTNFDDLFERASPGHITSPPRVFQAPALPLGNRFQGIVHLHGCVNEPEEMVLTHRDFGRAYLTESGGWARQFLIDLFANYTVLFAGYSHSDTIMTYLTPSLPPEGEQRRFALVGDQSDDLDHWKRMGIEPVVFPQANTGDFGGLDTAVAGLANFQRRGILDWQREIVDVAGGRPPIDGESVSIIERALTDPVLTPFFVNSAELPEWIDWIDRRGYLDRLFREGDLEDRDTTLSSWLADRFAITHSDHLFGVMARHGGRPNPHLWNRLIWSLRRKDETVLNAPVLSRWVHFLMTRVPPDVDDHLLLLLGETCASLGALQGLLQVYDILPVVQNHVPPGHWPKDGKSRQIRMSMFWEKCLEPHLPGIAHSLLERAAIQLEKRHSAIVAWGEGNATFDPDSYGRSAIEPHPQDSIPHEVDALVDVARDCLEWLAANDPAYAKVWCGRFAASDAPLLRRLAVHTVAAMDGLSADDKIAWMLEEFDINEFALHHEIFRAAAHAYPDAGSKQRAAFVQAIHEYQAPASEEYDNELLTACHRFDWLHWLQEADPNCAVVKEALDAVHARYPELRTREHPDFTHWLSSVQVTGPWTANGLLAKPASQVLPDLLTYEPTDQQRFEGHDRWELLRVVGEAARANPSWGIDLADALASMDAWDSDIWRHVIPAWGASELSQDDLKRVLYHLSAAKLHRQHPRHIADVLSALVRKANQANQPGATELLDMANPIAIALRPYAAADELPQVTSSAGGAQQNRSWLESAVNRASGQLAIYWTLSSELWRKQQDPAPQSLGVEYRDALDAILTKDGAPGKFGRTVLCSNFHFFLAVDEEWALGNLLPLFDAGHEDFHCAWDGFLTWGRLYLPTAERMRDKFLAAIPRIAHESIEQVQRRFVEFYVTMLGWLVNGAMDDLITGFFKHAVADMKAQFALDIGHRLHMLDEAGQREWWNVWIRDYWHNRLQGVPRPLDDSEIARMLEWVIHLPGVFPEAVRLATRMPPVSLGSSRIFHDLGESLLAERYPADLAKFLIHLGEQESDPWSWSEVREVVDRLLAKNLPMPLAQGLLELKVKRYPS